MTEFQQIVINLVNEGKTVSEIARLLNRNMSSVSSVVKRFNLTPTKAFKNTIKDDFFDIINSEEKAYLLGFFIADGCINKTTARSNGRFSINQSQDDKEIVKAFKKYLNVPNNIQIINNSSGVLHRKEQWRLRWTSVHMKETMESMYNIHPNKTTDTNFIFPINLIPNNLQRHFVRGFIDGDGYLGDNGQKNNFIVSIVGVSEQFLTCIGDLVSKETQMSYNIYKSKGKTVDYISLRWSCDKIDKLQKITKLRDYLYKDATIFLERKKEKIEAYIKYRANILDNTNIQCNAQEMKLEIEYNSPKSAQPLTGNAEGENVR